MRILLDVQEKGTLNMLSMGEVEKAMNMVVGQKVLREMARAVEVCQGVDYDNL